ncbi:MAG: hypothetical protein GC160_26610 [Acidobacteria bacterium]|nr:hypothetical protein [Acidobacteriota bacterium]
MRRLILVTSRQPLLGLYRGLYRAAAVAAARFVGRDPGVLSVYVRRGLAKGETVPGISDIDLAVITDPSDPGANDRALARYQRAKRLLPLLDESPEILDRPTLSANCSTTRHRYRLAEGRQTWQVLYGADDRAALPAAEAGSLQSSLYQELRYWWTLFNWQILRPGEARWDPVVRNAVCYKVVVELFKVRLALLEGTLLFGRREVLARVGPSLDEAERAMAERLRRMADQRFLRDDPTLLEDCFALVLRLLDRLHARLMHSPHFAGPAPLPVRVDGPRREWFWPPERERFLQSFLSEADRVAPGAFGSAYVVKGCDFPIHDFGLLLEPLPGSWPSVGQTMRLREARLSADQAHADRFHVYLLLEHCALQIDVDDRRGGWESTLRSVLSPFANPDVFAALAEPESLLRGAPRAPAPGAGWSPALAEMTHERRLAHEAKLLDSDAIRGWGAHGPLATALQLRLLEESAAGGELHYPLTAWALQRALQGRNGAAPEAVTRLLSPLAEGFDQANHNPAAARNALQWLVPAQ